MEVVTSKELELLGVDEGTYRVLGLLPLVWVAWADGAIQRAERRLILGVAEERGWLTGAGQRIIERWLTAPPTVDQLELGLEILQRMAANHRGEEAPVRVDTVHDLVGLAQDVAAAAGGLLGFKDPISPEEHKALERVAELLELRDEQLSTGAIGLNSPGLPAPGPKGRFLVGSLTELMRDPLDFLETCFRDHGPVVMCQVLRRPYMLLNRPDDIAHVLNRNAGNYVRGETYAAVERLLGKSLLTSEGQEWRGLRRIVVGAFRAVTLERFESAIRAATQVHLNGWRSDLPGFGVDVSHAARDIALSIIGEICVAGISRDQDVDLGTTVRTLLGFSEKVQSSPWRLPDILPTPERLRVQRAIQRLDEYLFRQIALRRSGGDVADDLLSLMVNARAPETGEALNDHHIRNELVACLLHGYESVGLALCWCLYLLARHTEVADRVVDESVAANDGWLPGLGQERITPMLDAVISETLRLYPPIWLFGRVAIAEDRVGGFEVPAGSQVLMSAWAVQRNPELWSEPECFRPERFLGEQGDERHALAWFPFGAGAHQCLAGHLTRMILRVVIPQLLQRHRLTLSSETEVALTAGVSLRPADSIRVHVWAR